MIVINHKINTIEKLKKTPKECGVEIDIRPYKDRLILHHDPFIEGEDFEEWLKYYNHSFLVLNIKSEGIENKVLELINKFKITNYVFLDVTFPFMIKYVSNGINNFMCRFSEFESVNTCLALKNKVSWVFVDNFNRLPIEEFKILSKHFKICIVSPEIFKRNELEITKKIVWEYKVDAVLTDQISAWGVK